MDDGLSAVLRRHFPRGWREQVPTDFGLKTPEMQQLCDAGLCSYGHVKAGHGKPASNVLLLTTAGFAALETIDAGATP